MILRFTGVMVIVAGVPYAAVTGNVGMAVVCVLAGLALFAAAGLR